jgi:hypothetical protein
MTTAPSKYRRGRAHTLYNGLNDGCNSWETDALRGPVPAAARSANG